MLKWWKRYTGVIAVVLAIFVVILGAAVAAEAVMLYKASWLPALGASVEFAKALAPLVAALIALIAVFVNLRNTRKQIDASADNLMAQLAASAENLKKQLHSQAHQAHAGRRAQLEHMVRAEHRDMLVNAAQVVFRIQGYARDIYVARLESQSADPTHMQLLIDKINAAGDELSFIRAAMRIIDLTHYADFLQNEYYLEFMRFLALFPGDGSGLLGADRAHVVDGFEALSRSAERVIEEFAVAVRIGPDPYAP
ncbi:hypothetical protein [Mycobacteroides salmoniphilum]|uniref:hypothetical protein n=1 Tax=Mycobacteroides salmoniphilum TaxID=404941 RepID=UPI000993DDF9|nr:hypothetical protein [Mycobacteroides salmoniphilum]